MDIYEVKGIGSKNGMNELRFKKGGVPNNDKRECVVLGVSG